MPKACCEKSREGSGTLRKEESKRRGVARSVAMEYQSCQSKKTKHRTVDAEIEDGTEQSKASAE